MSTIVFTDALPLSSGLKNRRDVARFIAELESGISTPLMSLTSGYHFHHITAESEEVLDEIEQALEDKGYLVDYTPFELENFLTV